MEERKGAATYKGQPVTLVGPEVKVGQRAPFFKAIGFDMQWVSLSQSKGKVRLLSVVHSLDTPVCDLQTQLFEQEAGEYSNVVIYTISMDLPFAQARYSREHNIRNLKTLSDYREASFGMAYGLLIKEMRLLSGGIFIVDADDMVRCVEYVKEITEAPDYYNAIEALKSIAEECSRQG
jgi:thioredoxin-dependent peroxiredoxin